MASKVFFRPYFQAHGELFIDAPDISKHCSIHKRNNQHSEVKWARCITEPLFGLELFLIRLTLEIQLTIKISELDGSSFPCHLGTTLESEECNGKDSLYWK